MVEYQIYFYRLCTLVLILYYNVLQSLYYNVTMCVTHVQTSPLPQIDANSRAIGGNRKS